MIPILLLFTATFHPAKPAVGDPITIQFPAPVVLDRSPDFEIVAQRGNTIVIRTFQPRPFPISGRSGAVRFRNMVVPVRSVLKPNDDMQPAPLKPPIREPYPRMPFIAIAIAALAAFAAWTAAALRREKKVPVVPALPPAEQFRSTVMALRRNPRAPMRWAKLADAVREYLAATTDLSRDLTTSEIIAKCGDGLQPVPLILRQGDLEKFSPWGPAPADFDALAAHALDLVPEPQEEVAA